MRFMPIHEKDNWLGWINTSLFRKWNKNLIKPALGIEAVSPS
jgi:hypothetical protein